MVLLFFILQLIIIVIDQLIKLWALNSLAPVGQMDMIPGIVEFLYVENRGVAFGMFSGNVWIVSLITGLALLGLCGAFLYYKPKSKLLIVSLAMVIGGGFGNLIDRVFRGFVVDYIEPTFMNFATFNFADICVCVGVGLLFICILLMDDKGEIKLGNRNGKTKFSSN